MRDYDAVATQFRGLRRLVIDVNYSYLSCRLMSKASMKWAVARDVKSPSAAFAWLLPPGRGAPR